MTDRDLRETIANLAVRQAEWGEQISQNQQEWRRQHAETERLFQEMARDSAETKRVVRETSQVVRELGKQIGGLGDKFGSFTEGMALPSMTKILEQRFHMDVIAPRVRAHDNGHTLEVDVLAYSRSRFPEAFVVEVKSHLREDGLEQIQKILREFHRFFPEHAGKKVYGILAAVDIPEDIQEKVLREGIYLAKISDDQFQLQVPRDFQPRAYGPAQLPS